MECEPCIKWFLIEYWMIIYSVSFACLFDWFCLWLRVCLIDFIWIKLFDWFADLFSNTCLIALCTLTMHSLVQLLPQDLTYGIGGAVLSFLGSPIEIKHNTEEGNSAANTQLLLQYCVCVFCLWLCLWLLLLLWRSVSVSVHFFRARTCTVSVYAFFYVCVCVRAFFLCL